MKKLLFVLCLGIVSCNPFGTNIKGKYLMIKKGYYSQLDFKDDKNVIIIDNLGYGQSFSTTYKIFDEKVYIKTDKTDLVFDIQPDLLTPSEEGNGIYKEFIGTFAREGSKVYQDALYQYLKSEEKVNTNIEKQGSKSNTDSLLKFTTQNSEIEASEQNQNIIGTSTIEFSKYEAQIGNNYEKKNFKSTIIISESIVEIKNDNGTVSYNIINSNEDVLRIENKDVYTNPLDYTYYLTIGTGYIVIESLNRDGSFPQRYYFSN